jgi:hypothetical protein
VLFLMFAPNAGAETAKEQLQGSMEGQGRRICIGVH